MHLDEYLNYIFISESIDQSINKLDSRKMKEISDAIASKNIIKLSTSLKDMPDVDEKEIISYAKRKLPEFEKEYNNVKRVTKNDLVAAIATTSRVIKKSVPEKDPMHTRILQGLENLISGVGSIALSGGLIVTIITLTSKFIGPYLNMSLGPESVAIIKGGTLFIAVGLFLILISKLIKLLKNASIISKSKTNANN